MVAALTILDTLVGFIKIIEGSVTVTLDSKSGLNKNGLNWPLSVDKASFNYLEVIKETPSATGI